MSHDSVNYKKFLIWTTVVVIAIRLRNFISMKILSNALIQQKYGQYSFSISLAFTLSSIIMSAVSITIYRYIPIFRANKKYNKENDLVISSLVLLLLFYLCSAIVITVIEILTKFFQNIYHKESIGIIVLILLFSFLYSTFVLFISISRIDLSIMDYSIMMISYEFGGLAGTIITIYCISDSIVYILLGMEIGSIVCFLPFLLKRLLSYKKGKINLKMLITIAKFGSPRILTDSSRMLFEYIAGVIIILKLSETSYAVFSVGMSIATILNFIITNFLSTFIPKVAKMFERVKDKNEKNLVIGNYIKLTSAFYLFILTPTLLIIYSFVDFLIKILSNENYLVIGQYLIFFLLYLIIYFLSKVIGVFLFLYNKTFQEALLTTISLSIGVLFAILLIPKYGYMGIGTAFLMFSLVHCIIIGIGSNRVIKTSINKRFFLNVVFVEISTFGMFFIVGYFLPKYFALIIVIPFFIVYNLVSGIIPKSEVKIFLKTIFGRDLNRIKP